MLRNKAFTLIELLVVIAIIGILASVVVASVNSAREKGRLGAGKHFEEQVEHIAGELLVGKWDFDDCPTGTTSDQSGYSNAGSLTNGAASSIDSPFPSGCSILFNGINSYVEVPNSSILNVTGAITITSWIKRSDTGSGSGKIAFKVNAANTQGYGTAITNHKFEFDIFGVSCDIRDASGGTTLATGKWYFVVATYDGTNCKTYVDGALDKTSPGTGSFAITNAALRFGGDKYAIDPVYPFFGYIDNVRIYGKALVASEIRGLYEEGLKTRGFAENK